MSNILKTLQASLPPNMLLTDPSECLSYSYDNSRYLGHADVVVLAETEQNIIDTLRCCDQYRYPLTVRGRGTGTPGGAVPLHGGLVLSLERFNQIKKIDLKNRYAIVEAGVLNGQLQTALAPHGFFWPPDPSSAAFCTIGGNLGYNAAGPGAIKYGTTRDNTLGLRAILANGDILQTGVHTTKGVVGYDLTRLLIGSEGTLAIITEATLKLTPKPHFAHTLELFYESIEAAVAAIISIMSQPNIPCALEFIDGEALNLLRQYTKLSIPKNAQALLILEVDGHELENLHTAVSNMQKAAQHPHLLSWQHAATPEQRQQIWQARKQLSPILRHFAPKKINEDVVVPIGNISKLLTHIQNIRCEFSIPIVCFGHAGNGNIHVNLLYDDKNPVQQQNAAPCLAAIFDAVLALEGTLSGEHGVGIDKTPFLVKELGTSTLEMMKKIKQAFDPKGILNPGKLFTSLYS